MKTNKKKKGNTEMLRISGGKDRGSRFSCST